MIQNFFDGDIKKATKMQLECLPLVKALFCEVNPIPVKAALNIMGYDFGIPRLPLVEISAQNKEMLCNEINNFCD